MRFLSLFLFLGCFLRFRSSPFFFLAFFFPFYHSCYLFTSFPFFSSLIMIPRFKKCACQHFLKKGCCKRCAHCRCAHSVYDMHSPEEQLKYGFVRTRVQEIDPPLLNPARAFEVA
ncbi:hypothetical protein STCU_10730 [Strigomonas culicis]|uniref:C3H1-type domain-containing protein n=1 Tax=Strigomonas culicis TaxID=28005 RepID=S9TGR6_9TRYP|nr:hypothetical protein STCU_10730 [Strigomonas culicis]|eukprot:EPY17242.1 hypothetical protein STCU_10730 [Strigomonas culicis]